MHTSPAPHLSYRPDIDGLRAFAVLAVICEHFGVAPFSGGYVGVDIFFVISGYLITSIILPQMQQGTFRFARFYERRCRRLLPALYAMLLCLALVPAVMPSFPFPEEMYQSLGATLLFAANMFFATRQGYFDAASGEKPLLHMWSLSVEEQFYCILPLLLLLLIKYGKQHRTLIPQVMSLILLASFLFAVVTVHMAQSMAFYWLPGRAWELCVGCLLAYALNHKDASNHTSTLNHTDALAPRPSHSIAPQHLLSLCALALLALPVLLYDRSTLFPAHNGGNVQNVGISYEEYLARTGQVRQLFAALQSDKVHVLDPAQILCAGGFCGTEKDGKSLYADDNHLTSYGLQVVKEAFAPLFSKLLNAKTHTERAPNP